MATNHDDHKPGADPQSIQRGHELDQFPIRGIMMVPAAVLVAFVVGFTVVTILINYLRSSPDDKKATDPTAQHHSAPLNARLDRISSTEPQATYKQPRLEGLQRFTTEDPPYVRSSTPTPSGNSPHFHPEDLRTDSKLAKELGLQDYSWRGTDKKEVRIPIQEAIAVASQKGSTLVKSTEKKLEDLRGPGTKTSNPHWAGEPKKPSAEGKH